MVFSSRTQAVWRELVAGVNATHSVMSATFDCLGSDCWSWLQRIALSGKHVFGASRSNVMCAMAVFSMPGR